MEQIVYANQIRQELRKAKEREEAYVQAIWILSIAFVTVLCAFVLYCNL